jgi:lipopolysaccharide export system protein LptA
VATARQAQYYAKEGRVVLSGDVDVIQADGHAIKAERVVYDVNRERITAEPPVGGQVISRYRMASPTPGAGGGPTPGVGGGPTPGVGGTKP